VSGNSLIYVSNAGVLLNLGGKKILIDALTLPGNDIYKDTEPLIRDKIIQGIPPFDQIDLFLVTHHHRDHFDAESVINCLEYQQGLVLVSTQEVVSRLSAYSGNVSSNRCFALNPTLYGSETMEICGVTLSAFRTLHDGEGYETVQNLMFVLKHGITVVHLGDTAPKAMNFEPFKSMIPESVSVLIANFPYIALPVARKMIQAYINPEKVVVVHFPDPEKPAGTWTEIARKSFERVKSQFAPTIFMEQLGSELEL
jgi:L-ascorbate metabolism protein UlaG (beta-lactamase superfamily)